MNRSRLLVVTGAGLLIGTAASLGAGAGEPPSDGAGCRPGNLRSYSTIRSIGIEWDVAGDKDHDATCTVQYRPKQSAVWREALPLFRVDYQWWYADRKAERPANLFAGSILFLKPATRYQVRLELSDPDGGAAAKTLSIATRPVPRPPGHGRSLHVVPGSGGGDGSDQRPFQGLKAAQAAAKPGDTFLLRGGDYGSFTLVKSGGPDNHIVWKAAGDGDAVFDALDVAASYLWLEGLTLTRGQRSTGLRAQGRTTNVVIRGNRFTGFHYSLLLSRESQNWHIVDNRIIGDNHPIRGGISGEGIELNHSGGHVVAYNRISRVADGISYPERNCDIHGNDIFDVSDDGLEPDRGYANVRMWANRIYNYKNNAISFQPMRCGPWYIIRNQVIGRGQIFKFRVQDRFLLAHNTFVRWGPAGNRMHHILSSLSRNNLYIAADGSSPIWVAYDCRQPQYCLPNNYRRTWMTDVDYDGFDWGTSPRAFRWENDRFFPDLKRFADAVGIQRHAVRVRKEDIFRSYEVPNKPGPVAAQHLTLRQGSDAVDAGAVLPNINEDFTGKAPDLGAHEFGTPLPHYGPRQGAD